MEKNSTKNLAVVVLVALGIVSLGFFASRGPAKTETGQGGASLTTENRNPYQDSDNDGLFDWQEALWKTDSQNPDTDGDGTPDGEEVKTNRDPLVKGPDDGIFKANTISNNQLPESSNITDAVAKKIVNDYLLELSKDPEEELDESLDFIPDYISQELASFSKDQYSKNDILTYQTENKDGLKVYFNSLGEILKKNADSLKDQINEIVLVNTFLNEPKTLSEELKTHIEVYNTTRRELGRLSAPSQYATLHTEILNIINNAVTAAQSMSPGSNDPAKTLLGMSLYFEQRKRLEGFFENARKELEKENIKPLSEEGTYFFVK